MNCKIFNQAVYLNNSYDTNTDTQFYSTNFNKSHNISKYKNKNYTYRRLKSAATIPAPRAVRARKFRPQQTRLKCSTRVPISNVPPYQIAFSPSPPLVLSWNASEIPPCPFFHFPLIPQGNEKDLFPYFPCIPKNRKSRSTTHARSRNQKSIHRGRVP